MNGTSGRVRGMKLLRVMWQVPKRVTPIRSVRVTASAAVLLYPRSTLSEHLLSVTVRNTLSTRRLSLRSSVFAAYSRRVFARDRQVFEEIAGGPGWAPAGRLCL